MVDLPGMPRMPSLRPSARCISSSSSALKVLDTSSNNSDDELAAAQKQSISAKRRWSSHEKALSSAQEAIDSARHLARELQPGTVEHDTALKKVHSAHLHFALCRLNWAKDKMDWVQAELVIARIQHGGIASMRPTIESCEKTFDSSASFHRDAMNSYSELLSSASPGVATVLKLDDHGKKLSKFWKYLWANPHIVQTAISTLTDDSHGDSIRVWPSSSEDAENMGLYLPFGRYDARGEDCTSITSSLPNIIMRASHIKRVDHTIDRFINNRPKDGVNGILLFGHPGIGKTATLNVIALAAVLQKKTLVLQYGPTHQYAYILEPSGKCTRIFGPHFAIADFMCERYDRSSLVYLFDPAQITEASADTLQLHNDLPQLGCPSFFATSPKSATYCPDKHTGYTLLPMDPWMAEDIRAVKPLFPQLRDLDDVELEHRTKILGGNLRNILSSNLSKHIERQKKSIQGISSSVLSIDELVDDLFSHTITYEPYQPPAEHPDWVLIPDDYYLQQKLINDDLVKLLVTEWLKDTGNNVSRRRVTELPMFSPGQAFELRFHVEMVSPSSNTLTATHVSKPDRTMKLKLSGYYDHNQNYAVVDYTNSSYYNNLLNVVLDRIASNVTSSSCHGANRYHVAPMGCSLIDSYSYSLDKVGMGGKLVVNLFQVTVSKVHDLKSERWNYFYDELKNVAENRELELEINFVYVVPTNHSTAEYSFPSECNNYIKVRDC